MLSLDDPLVKVDLYTIDNIVEDTQGEVVRSFKKVQRVSQDKEDTLKND